MSNIDLPYLAGCVISNDGTSIAYRKFGEGPALVLLHGSLSASQHLMELGRSLARDYTVYIVDRRGRGQSPPFGSGYCLDREVEDLTALLFKSRARLAFGAGTGALIVLKALLSYSGVRKAALYEPPLDVDGSLLEQLAPVMRRYDREMARGHLAEALTTVLTGAGMLPDTFVSKLPRFVLTRSFRQAMEEEREAALGTDAALESLIPTQSYDYKLMIECKGSLESFRMVPAEVLLLGGSHSPLQFKKSLAALEGVIPHALREELKGMGHTGPTGGEEQSERIAEELKKFFGTRML